MTRKTGQADTGSRIGADGVEGVVAVDATGAFADLAKANEHAAFPQTPALLVGTRRRAFVRATIREDHRMRIEESAAGAEAKFDKLAGSRFAFFRGTALLFYRDMVGADAAMPTVLALGDVHPGNFGVMPNADNAPIFSVNDFDECCYAPFTWDLKRGAVGFWLGADEVGGQETKNRRRIVKHFIKGYHAAMCRFAEGESEKRDAFRIDNSPKIIRRLFDDAETPRATWLRDKYLDETGRGFRSSEELTPISTRKAEFQKRIRNLVKESGLKAPERAGKLKVKDVAIRHGQGTASLGLPRYYVLIEGPAQDATDDLIIEFKQARRSALEGLTPPNPFTFNGKAERIAHGQSVHLLNGDVFYGAVEIDGMSFMTRERSPFREDIDMDDLSDKEWRKYAHVCGEALAQAHALSDDLGRIDYDVDRAVIDAMAPLDLFIDDMIAFAEETADRLARDHDLYREDHALGAFQRIEIAYR